jgi:hypothetical protein
MTHTALLSCVGLLFLGSLHPSTRSDWYWDSPVNLHIDNHSAQVGKGKTPEELAEMLRPLPVDLVQVSALGADGQVSYPSAVGKPSTALEGWDTMASWAKAAKLAGKRFHIYINTRGISLGKEHPDWVQLNAEGKGNGHRGGDDLCARPSDGTGFLEAYLLPLIRELATGYKPGGLWVDGDHARTPVCYCRHCKAAWKKTTGQDEPPVRDDHPDWPRWLSLEQERYDAYRRAMSKALHDILAAAFYTSNHSWRKIHAAFFSTLDPRTPPEWAATLSADLSHSKQLFVTRVAAMFLSPEAVTPHDIMHLVNGPETSLRRLLQNGAVTLASGSSWFLWSSGRFMLDAGREPLKACADFVQERRGALGRTLTANTVAVLASEASWVAERSEGKKGAFGFMGIQAAAVALEDAGYGVDIVNEADFARRPDGYRLLVLPGVHRVSPSTLAGLRRFAESGGTLLSFGPCLEGMEPGTAERLFGISAGAKQQQGEFAFEMGGVRGTLFRRLTSGAGAAGKKAAFADGAPLLLTKPVGKGTAATLAILELSQPDSESVLAAACAALGLGPQVAHGAGPLAAHFVYAYRQRGAAHILHMSDLTSQVGGRRTHPDSMEHKIDALPRRDLELRVAWSQKPAAVKVYPASVALETSWADGVLMVKLSRFDVHAALELSGGKPGFLPAQTPRHTHLAQALYAETTFVAGFETESQGQALDPLSGFHVLGKGKATVAPGRERAFKGQGSLRFTDDPSAPQAFLPFAYLEPNLAGAEAELRFALWLEPGSEITVEMRTEQSRKEKPVGPSVICRAGQLSTHDGKALCELPAGKWLSFTLQARLDGSGRYELSVSGEGMEERRFPGLDSVSKEFRRAGWIGFIGSGTNAASCWLDEVSVTARRAGAPAR